MIKYAIFDLDGTLVNTIADLRSSVNYALSMMNYPLRSEEEVKSFVGNGIAKLVERALPGNAKETQHIEKALSFFTDYYDIHCKDFSKPYTGIPQLLKEMKKRGITLAVASNKYQKATSKIITSLFPEETFASIFGQRDGIPRKPEPEIIFQILKEMCPYPPSAGEVILIGDSQTDILTARNASIPVCAVTWGFRPLEELKKYEPDYLATTPDEIMNFII